MHNWQMQEAKQHLSEVVRLAQADPQRLTLRGEPCAWIISDKDYLRLTKQDVTESIVDFFQRSPHRDIELKIERRKDLPRKVDL